MPHAREYVLGWARTNELGHHRTGDEARSNSIHPSIYNAERRPGRVPFMLLGLCLVANFKISKIL